MYKTTIGIDASRCKSGGAVKHLYNILRCAESDLKLNVIIHVWAHPALAEQLSGFLNVKCHIPKSSSLSVLHQLFWQAFFLSREARALGCSVMFAADASSLCNYYPMVTLSQDLLAYEPGLPKAIKSPKTRLRLLVIRAIQNLAFRRSQGIIALTQYGADLIRKSAGITRRIDIIAHGVDDEYRLIRPRIWRSNGCEIIKCIYISPIAEYKFQRSVIDGIRALRDDGYCVGLTLVGGGEIAEYNKCISHVKNADPSGDYLNVVGHVDSAKLTPFLADSDIFIFASGCESFGITLLEGMAAGLPIACADRSSMPDTLEDGGVYFDPENSNSIKIAIQKLIDDVALRSRVSKRAKEISNKYTWQNCSKNTFKTLMDVACDNKFNSGSGGDFLAVSKRS